MKVKGFENAIPQPLALTYAGAMITAQYLACLCDIAACLSGSQEVAELAHCTDNIAQVCTLKLTTGSQLLPGCGCHV